MDLILTLRNEKDAVHDFLENLEIGNIPIYTHMRSLSLVVDVRTPSAEVLRAHSDTIVDLRGSEMLLLYLCRQNTRDRRLELPVLVLTCLATTW